MGNVSSDWDSLLTYQAKQAAGINKDGGGRAVGEHRRQSLDQRKGSVSSISLVAPPEPPPPPAIALVDPVSRFDNLSGQDIEALWRTFVAHQESFAVTMGDLVKIMAVLKDSVGGSDPANSYIECTKSAEALFKYWSSTIINKYVDIMEIIMALLFTSKMPTEDKINFLFDCMDFDGDDDLDFDELAISMKSVEGGLAKLRGKLPSTHQKIIELVREWFPSTLTSGNSKISRTEFAKFCLKEDGVPYRIFQLYAEAEGESSLELEEDLALRGRLEKPEGGGDEFMAIKPWLGAIKAPTEYTKKSTDSSAPDSFLLLDWIHGYTVEGAYDNVRYMPGQEKETIVYNAAAVGVVMTRDSYSGDDDGGSQASQSFFLEHTDDVISLAVGMVPDRQQGSKTMMGVVATGELGKKPKVEVWFPPSDPYSANKESPKPLFSFDGLHQRGICSLSFSCCYDKQQAQGSNPYLLVSVGLDDDHTVGVYSVDPSEANKKKGLLVCSAKGSKQRVLCTQWNPYFNKQHGSATQVHFVTCGIKSVDLWTIDLKTSKLKSTRAVFDKFKVVTFLAVAFLPDDGNVVVGTSIGSLYIFKGRDCVKEITSSNKGATDNKAVVAHDGAVLSLCNHPTANYIVSAGKDGKVILWGARADLIKLAVLDIMTMPGVVPVGGETGIRSVQLRDDRKALLVGASNGSVYEVALQGSLPAVAPATSLTLNLDRPQALVHSHFKGEVWGLAVFPQPDKARLYCTVGDDCTLRLWDLDTRRQIRVKQLQGAARACAWSPDGTLLAVGYGTGTTGKERHKTEGTLEVFEFDLSKALASSSSSSTTQGEDQQLPPDPFNSKHVAKDAKEWISDIKFTPDGKTLAAGSHDNCVYLYSVFQTFKRRAKFSKHNSYITHFDFSADSRFMQSNCGAYELLFANVQTAQHITDPKEMKDVQWSTWSCTLGWPVQGIWPPCSDGTDINAVDRTSDGSVLATGDDFGRVRLFRYPCAGKQAASNMSVGHSSHVSCVRWAPAPTDLSASNSSRADGEYLISTGGNDKCVFQWSHHRSGTADGATGTKRSNSKKLAAEVGAGNVDESLAPKTKVSRPGAEVNSNDPDVLVALDDETGGGDEFMATKPWLGNIVTPSPPQKLEEVKWELDAQLNGVLRRQGSLRRVIDQEGALPGSSNKGGKEDPKKKEFLERLRTDGARVNELVCKAMRGDTDKAPDDDGLSLEWIHGYRCDDCRNNVRYDAEGTMVYHAAAMGVMLKVDDKTDKRSQRFNLVHTDDIISFAMHPNQKIVATGQVGSKPKIQVWEVNRKAVRSTLQGFHVRGVSLLTFSSEGDLLISVGQDDEHSIAIYEWATGTLRGSTKGGRDNILAVEFMPTGSTDFISCGVQHIKVWTRQGQNLAARQLRGGESAASKKEAKKPSSPPAYTTIAWLGSDAVIGCSTGHVYHVPMHGAKDKDLKLPSPVVARKGSGPAHDGSVFASSNNTARTQVLTGGKDGRVIAWGDQGGSMLAQWVLDISSATPSQEGWEVNVAPLALRGSQFASVNAAIRSVQASPRDPNRFLIGTQGAEILEVKVVAGKGAEVMHDGALVTGHCKDEVWGLAVHPTDREYITVGDDHTLRKWDVPSKRQVDHLDLGGMARACAYSPDGLLIAVGMGGSVGRGRQRMDGMVKLIDNGAKRPKPMQEVHKTCDAKEWISDIKFTPDGKTLAAGSHDNCVYLYSVQDKKLKLRAKFNKHNSYITHFDFSTDSHYMQSNCGAYELIFSNVQTANMQRAAEMKDVQWSTWSCTLGWPVQGIWPPCSNGTDINSVDRSHVGTLLATADDFGKVKLFRYPCVHKGAQFQEYLGHSAHVTSVRWTAFDECLISTGGGDKCVFQWYNNVADDGGYSVVSKGGEQQSPTRKAPSSNGGKAEAAGTSSGAAAGGRKWAPGSQTSKEDRSHEETEDIDGISDMHVHLDITEDSVGGGDEFMAVKPWLGAIKAPTRVDGVEGELASNSSCTRAPQTDLQLEWVYGYAGHSYRNNLFYTATEEVVYPAAAVGVVMKVDHGGSSSSSGADGKKTGDNDGSVGGSGDGNKQQGVRFGGAHALENPKHQQTFYRGHEKDIVSMAICSQRRFVATGDLVKVGKQPSIHIWDSNTSDHVATLPTFHKRGICALSFREDDGSGEVLLASVGLDDDHTVAVWKDTGGAWSKVVRQAVGKGDNNVVCFALWARLAKGTEDPYPLVTGGAKHIRFWKVSGTTLSSKKGVFGKIQQPSALLCAANLCMNGEWRLATGASTGEILMWSGRDCVLSRPAHDKAVQCMVGVGGETEDMSRLITGGKEGKVKVWNWSLESIQEYDISSFRHSIEPSLRAIDVISRKTAQAAKQLNIASLLIGTGGGEVFEIPTDQRQFDATIMPLVHSHFMEETWGLDVPLSSLPKLQNVVVTSGDDGTVRIWDVGSHAMVGRYLLPKRRAAAAAPAAGSTSPSKAKKAGGTSSKKPAAQSGNRHEGGGEDEEEAAVSSSHNNAGGAAPTAERQMSRAVAWEPSLGQYIAVGLGGDVGKSKTSRLGGHLIIRVDREKGGRWEVKDKEDKPFPMYVSRLEREWVSDIKWCPRSSPTMDSDEQGRVLLRYATGSHDNFIRVFGVWSSSTTDEDDHRHHSSSLEGTDGPAPAPQYLLRLQGHNSYITHFDVSIWEEGRQYLQSNCGAYELLFWNVTPPNEDTTNNNPAGDKKKGSSTSPDKQATSSSSSPEATVSLAPMAKASTTRNTTWASWTCTLGWPAQGIWSGTMDGTDVNAVCRIVDYNGGGDQVPRLGVAGDDGKVKIYQYPCVATNAEFVEGSAHSSHVTNIRYAPAAAATSSSNNNNNNNNNTGAATAGGTRLFTTGGNDKCLMQWRVVSLG